jgi:myo-inositol-1(or 4)-monophosphatase
MVTAAQAGSIVRRLATPTEKALAADWIGLCGRATKRLREMLVEHPATVDRDVGTARGAGGDRTLVIDSRAEDVVFAELDALHAEGHDFTAISEERGAVTFGDADSAVRVVIDPIDGSLNAKRLIPSYSLSVAVASGGTMEDVEIAYVYDFGTGEEFTARRNHGAALGGRALELLDDGGSLEVVGFESARPDWIAPVAAHLEGKVYRMRVIGTIALSLCYVAAARFDGMVTTDTCRSVDAAAGQLIAREAGAFVDFLKHGGIEAPLDLDARYRLVAARAPEHLETLVTALTVGRPLDE